MAPVYGLDEGSLGRRLATLFVDTADSTRLVVNHPPETTLGAVLPGDMIVRVAQRIARHLDQALEGTVHLQDEEDGDGDRTAPSSPFSTGVSPSTAMMERRQL